MAHDHLRTESLRDLRRMHGRGKPPAKAIEPYARPSTRADCDQIPRPCPFAGCRYNLALDVTEGHALRYRAGSFAAEMPQDAPSCALDVAAEGAHTLDSVAQMLGLRRSRAAAIERGAMAKLAGLAKMAVLADEAP